MLHTGNTEVWFAIDDFVFLGSQWAHYSVEMKRITSRQSFKHVLRLQNIKNGSK